MKALRKALGIFLLILAPLLALSMIGSTARGLKDIPAEPGPERYGEITGTVISVLLMIWLVYFLIKKGIKLIKNKPKSEIEEIGKM